MFKTTTKAIALAITMTTLSSSAFAQSAPEGFTYSDELSASLAAHRSEIKAFNAIVKARIEGLTEEERQAVFEEYAAQAEALRGSGRALRELGVAEMKAAGFTPPADRPKKGAEQGSSNGVAKGRPDHARPQKDDDAADDRDGDRPVRPERGPRPPRPARNG